MSTTRAPLLAAIDQLVEGLPIGAIAPLAAALAAVPPHAWSLAASATQQVLAVPVYRERVRAFLVDWQTHAPDTPPASIALALQAAAYTSARHRHAQSLELVWTGPASAQRLRRTAQVLQELIDQATREVLIVSFAVYDIPEIGQALLRAARRSVQIRLVIESPKESSGRLAYDSLAAFGSQVTAQSQIYCWPAEHRPKDATGRSGSLHAKCAVADTQTLLISSANLTHYALNLNMELGVLIRGGELPRQVHTHVAELIALGTLTKVPPR